MISSTPIDTTCWPRESGERAPQRLPTTAVAAARLRAAGSRKEAQSVRVPAAEACRLTIVERHGATPGAQTVLCNPTSQDAG